MNSLLHIFTLRRIRGEFCIFVITILAATVTASNTTMTLQQATGIFATGNAAYRAQKFEQAAESYRLLIQAGYDTAPVLYNMGTTAARLNKKGEAAGYLMRAHRLDPRDDNIRANLARLTQAPATTDQPAVTAGSSAESVWQRATGYFTPGEWLAMVWIALMFICICCAILFTLRNHKTRNVARGLIWFGAGALAIVIIPATFQVYKNRIVHRSIATASSTVLSGPAERFTSVSPLAEGQVVTTLKHETEGYQQIQLENGQQGYTKRNILMPLQ
jgi:hypothetical protein